MAAARGVPIVMLFASLPVELGYGASLARPGGNITGLSALDHGILLTYGWRAEDLVRRLPHYIDRILKGGPLIELSVERPTRFYTTLNLKTARARGLPLPQSLLLQATEVVE
jgi:ABC-type uncharacterized transport system substrate-binding protein